MQNKINLEVERRSIFQYAMRYGALLGIFWIFKYLFKIGAGMYDSSLLSIYHLLDIGTAILIYIFTVKFIKSEPDKPRGFWPIMLFVIFLCFFASIFQGAIEFAHYKFIDPAYFSEIVKAILAEMDNTKNIFPGMSDTDFNTAIDINKKIFSSEITYVILQMIANLFTGLFLGLVMGILLRTNKNQA